MINKKVPAGDDVNFREWRVADNILNSKNYHLPYFGADLIKCSGSCEKTVKPAAGNSGGDSFIVYPFLAFSTAPLSRSEANIWTPIFLFGLMLLLLPLTLSHRNMLLHRLNRRVSITSWCSRQVLS